MKEKILVALKTKYKTFGFGDKAFDGVADYLSKTVTGESAIETAIGGVENLLKAFQGDIDTVRNEKSGLQKQLDELKAKGDESKKDEKQPPADDLDAKLEALINAKVAPLQEKLTAYETKESKATRQAQILGKAKELGIPDWRINEGFTITDDADEASISTTLSAIKQNIVTAGLEQNKGFAMSSSEAESKEAAKAWASSLPD